MEEFYAHSANSQDQRHKLGNHIKGTVEKAANMAAEFGCAKWGYLAGLWHDLSKHFPPEFLSPILAVLHALQKYYRVTLVLSTATQPALEPHELFDFNFSGIPEIVEIMKDPSFLHTLFKHVDVQIPGNLQISMSWEDLVSDLKRYPSVYFSKRGYAA